MGLILFKPFYKGVATILLICSSARLQRHKGNVPLITNNEDDRIITRLLVRPEARQKVLDALQTVLHNADNYRVLITPVDTLLPKPVEADFESLTAEQQEDEKAKEKE